MENATKALLIAAAVLIVIVLIALGIRILSATTGVSNSVGEVSDAMGKSVFNSQFTKFTGTQSASEVKALLSQAAATHRGDSKHKVNVTMGGTTYNNANGIAGLMSTLQINSSYTVTITSYDDDGYITAIKIQ